MDRAGPSDLRQMAADNRYSFRANADNVLEIRLEAPSWLERLGGVTIGSLHVAHRDRGKITFLFQSVQDMQQAVALLPDVLGDKLSLNAVLDQRRMRFSRQW
jgi:hypothetical protein